MLFCVVLCTFSFFFFLAFDFFSSASFILSAHEGGNIKIPGETSHVMIRPKMLGGLCMSPYKKSTLDTKQYLILCHS